MISRHSEGHSGIKGTGIEKHTKQLKKRRYSPSANCEEIKFSIEQTTISSSKKEERKEVKTSIILQSERALQEEEEASDKKKKRKPFLMNSRMAVSG